MVYRGQQDYLCLVDITPSFAYTVQENNYATFYGKDGKAWSLQFSNAGDARNFAIHVALAKFFVSGQKNIVVLEEPMQMSGTHVLGTGDSAGIKYTTWLTKPDTGALSTQIDSNATKDGVSRITLGDHSTSFPAWHAALNGRKKGFKGIVVSPPAMAFGEAGVAGTIPPNSIIVFELEVARVKRAAPAAAPAHAEAPVSASLNAPSTLFDGYPAGDAVSSAEAQKTELMQRLARAGAKPMIGSPAAPGPATAAAQIPAQPLPQQAAAAAPQPMQQQQPQQQQPVCVFAPTIESHNHCSVGFVFPDIYCSRLCFFPLDCCGFFCVVCDVRCRMQGRWRCMRLSPGWVSLRFVACFLPSVAKVCLAGWVPVIENFIFLTERKQPRVFPRRPQCVRFCHSYTEELLTDASSL